MSSSPAFLGYWSTEYCLVIAQNTGWFIILAIMWGFFGGGCSGHLQFYYFLKLKGLIRQNERMGGSMNGWMVVGFCFLIHPINIWLCLFHDMNGKISWPGSLKVRKASNFSLGVLAMMNSEWSYADWCSLVFSHFTYTHSHERLVFLGYCSTQCIYSHLCKERWSWLIKQQQHMAPPFPNVAAWFRQKHEKTAVPLLALCKLPFLWIILRVALGINKKINIR